MRMMHDVQFPTAFEIREVPEGAEETDVSGDQYETCELMHLEVRELPPPKILREMARVQQLQLKTPWGGMAPYFESSSLPTLSPSSRLAIFHGELTAPAATQLRSFREAVGERCRAFSLLDLRDASSARQMLQKIGNEADAIFIYSHGSPAGLLLNESVWFAPGDLQGLALPDRLLVLGACFAGSDLPLSALTGQGPLVQLPVEHRLLEAAVMHTGVRAVVGALSGSSRFQLPLLEELALQGGGQSTHFAFGPQYRVLNRDPVAAG